MNEAKKNPRQQRLMMAAGQWATPRVSANAIRRRITEFDTFGRRDAVEAIEEIEQRY